MNDDAATDSRRARVRLKLSQAFEAAPPYDDVVDAQFLGAVTIARRYAIAARAAGAPFELRAVGTDAFGDAWATFAAAGAITTLRVTGPTADVFDGLSDLYARTTS